MRGESLQKLTQKKAAMEELRKKVIFRKQIKNDKIPFIITWNVLNGLKSLIQRQILIYLKKAWFIYMLFTTELLQIQGKKNLKIKRLEKIYAKSLYNGTLFRYIQEWSANTCYNINKF